jgi:hypothetical protein
MKPYSAAKTVQNCSHRATRESLRLTARKQTTKIALFDLRLVLQNENLLRRFSGAIHLERTIFAVAGLLTSAAARKNDSATRRWPFYHSSRHQNHDRLFAQSAHCRLKVRWCGHHGHTGKIRVAINVAKRSIISIVLYTTW